MKIRCFILLLILLGGFKTKAQQNFTVKGIVFKNGSTDRIISATITNTTQHSTTQTDEFGTFAIVVALGDTLNISKTSFQEINKVIAKKQNMLVYLNNATVLTEVVVKAKSIKQEQKEILAGYKSKGVYNNGKTPFLMYIFNPLSALQNLLSKDAKNAKTFYKYISRENGEDFIDGKFNIMLIKNNTNINETDIAEFMYTYRPTYLDVKYWNDYDAIKYIKNSFLKYQETKKNNLRF
jgi:hypothetical protein